MLEAVKLAETNPISLIFSVHSTIYFEYVAFFVCQNIKVFSYVYRHILTKVIYSLIKITQSGTYLTVQFLTSNGEKDANFL